MVKLDAHRENGRISISERSFDHLLACLDNQKFVGEGPPNGDALAMGQEAFEATQNEIQAAIDDFNRQCRKFQNGGGSHDHARRYLSDGISQIPC